LTTAQDGGIEVDGEIVQVKLVSISELFNFVCHLLPCRNLSADVTRFLPTALRVKREDKKKKDAKNTSLSGELICLYKVPMLKYYTVKT
jgi:hypothetical protein